MSSRAVIICMRKRTRLHPGYCRTLYSIKDLLLCGGFQARANWINISTLITSMNLLNQDIYGDEYTKSNINITRIYISINLNNAPPPNSSWANVPYQGSRPSYPKINAPRQLALPRVQAMDLRSLTSWLNQLISTLVYRFFSAFIAKSKSYGGWSTGAANTIRTM